MQKYEVTTHDDTNPTEIVEASSCKAEEGALYFYGERGLVRAFRAGAWHSMRIVGPESTP